MRKMICKTINRTVWCIAIALVSLCTLTACGDDDPVKNPPKGESEAKVYYEFTPFFGTKEVGGLGVAFSGNADCSISFSAYFVDKNAKPKESASWFKVDGVTVASSSSAPYDAVVKVEPGIHNIEMQHGEAHYGPTQVTIKMVSKLN